MTTFNTVSTLDACMLNMGEYAENHPTENDDYDHHECCSLHAVTSYVMICDLLQYTHTRKNVIYLFK